MCILELSVLFKRLQNGQGEVRIATIIQRPLGHDLEGGFQITPPEPCKGCYKLLSSWVVKI